jgi:predicted GTPase
VTKLRSPAREAERPELQTPSAERRTLFFWRWRFWVLVACLGLPLLAFGGAGSLWLYERNWLGWAGLAFLCGEALALLLFRRWTRLDGIVLPQPLSSPPAEFSPREEAAWRLIQEYQERVDRNEIVLTSLEQFLSLGREILGRVAAFYRPEDKEPLLAVQVPLLFRAIEETARDLAAVTATLPLAHRVTISEMVRGYQVGQKLKPAYELYQLYRVLSPLLNWQSGLFRILVTDRLFDLAQETLSQWLLKWYVDRVGYHAIELYSGKLLLTQRIAADSLPTLLPGTAETLDQARGVTVEPLRILILGQVKAGKSSLVNALFGEARAAVDVLPTTTQTTPYILDRPELGGLVILSDMGGYEDPLVARERVEEALVQAQRSDVLLLVVSAVNAAREPDCQLLAQLRAHFAAHPDLRPPAVVVVLTHIDLLRPSREWTPPYNVLVPDSAKARSIRGGIDAVATDLGLSPQFVVPVCLLPERRYNVEEALAPLLLQMLPEAKRVLLLRSLKTLREQEQWELLWRQAKATGRFLLEVGGEVVRKSIERVLKERRL